ncbi:MAG: hypothetical protein VKJ44_00940 [Synechococcus sp.]|nr:hypothetical protein [Synechococcus sp.]
MNVSRRRDPALIGHPLGGAVAGLAPRLPRPQRLLAALLALVLFVLSGLPVAPAVALDLPWRRGSAAASAQPAGRRSPMLQELSAPAPVRQLQAALAGRQPVVEILSPRDDSLLDGSPWTLKLRVHDWPLVQGGALGPGPHVVVQLDQEPARIWTELEGTLPPLSPGSHRLTVYAALPWGEALRAPGAWQQIRLHRTAANPLVLPTRGSPQLLAVSPPPRVSAEPLLLDWLLLDAPLQNLRGATTDPWRLRISINGDSFLLDQQTPLWLQGWRPGVNALRLELLDDRGNPLNPPFNSLVQEVVIDPAAPAPRWLGEPLSAAELAVLLGRAPAPESPRPVAAADPPRKAPGSGRDRSHDQLPAAPSVPPTPPQAESAGAEPAGAEATDPTGAEAAEAAGDDAARAGTASTESPDPADFNLGGGHAGATNPGSSNPAAAGADRAGVNTGAVDSDVARDNASAADSETNAARSDAVSAGAEPTRTERTAAGSRPADRPSTAPEAAGQPAAAAPSTQRPEPSSPVSLQAAGDPPLAAPAAPGGASAPAAIAGDPAGGAEPPGSTVAPVPRISTIRQAAPPQAPQSRDPGGDDDNHNKANDRDRDRSEATLAAGLAAGGEPDRIPAASPLGSRAGDLVAPAGTLLQQPSPGPLQRLRSWLTP